MIIMSKIMDVIDRIVIVISAIIAGLSAVVIVDIIIKVIRCME